MTPFEINIPEADVADLRARLAAVRRPELAPGAGWERGVPADYLFHLIRYWATEFDWRAIEKRVNAFPQFRAEIDGQVIHFLHVRSASASALPLLITHGYPGGVLEFLDIIGPLSETFHLVIPSLPGYGFSSPLGDQGWEATRTAQAWVSLMASLGYLRYGVHGADIGAGVSGLVASLDPTRVVGVHVATDPMALAHFATLDESSLSPAEASAYAELKASTEDGNGYLRLQATRPSTIGYALADSPAGQLAWIVEKFREWTDPTRDLPEDAVDKDVLLGLVSLYWFTRTGGSAANFIYEAFHAPQSWGGPSAVPTGVACFAANPLARRLMGPVSRWRDYERGGHFAAMEVPALLVDDLREFYSTLQ